MKNEKIINVNIQKERLAVNSLLKLRESQTTSH